MRYVRDDYLLLMGRTRNNLKVDEGWSNKERFNLVYDRVSDQFGDRAILVSDKDDVLVEYRPYPEYFAAGWFISGEPTENTGAGSELVIISHGNSLEGAKNALMIALSNVSWEVFAANI